MNRNDTRSSSDYEFSDGVQACKVVSHTLTDDGTFPNNHRFPLLVYQGALELPEDDAAETIEALLETNRWGGTWRGGIDGSHHYHSNTHEAIAVYSGTATVQFGGEQGVVLSLSRGDVVIIPPGVAHKRLDASSDFRCIGAYPPQQKPDWKNGIPSERPQADENMANIVVPELDPIYGRESPVADYWARRKGRY